MRHGTIIFINGVQQNAASILHTILSGIPFSLTRVMWKASYGIDYDADANIDEDDSETVSIPEINLPLSDASLSMLTMSLDPLQQSDSYGADIYLQAVNLVYQLMISDGLTIFFGLNVDISYLSLHR